MGRRKIEIKAIKDDRNRSVTFLKRKGGLFKKAHELSVLCSVDVAVFIFGNNKKLYEYSSADMRDLITRYQYHGGPSEHKGPGDFNGGNHDDDDDEDMDGTPPRGPDGMESQMMPPQFQGQPPPPFPQVRHHTPSASPPISNGVPFQGHPAHMPRSHTPQPQITSRPNSRNDMRQMGRGMAPQHVGPHGPHPGITYMPTPPIYNPPASQQNLMPPGPPYPYQTQQHQHQHQHQHQQPYMEERRPSAPPLSTRNRLHKTFRLSLPERRHLDPQPPPPPGEPKMEPLERPKGPYLNTEMAVKKLPQRKSHSIFTPIEENRSILSQHLASFASEPQPVKNDQSTSGGPINRSQSAETGRNGSTASPHLQQRSSTRTASISSLPETTLTPPSQSNNPKANTATGGGRARGPRLTVQIPDGGSEADSATGESNSPRNPAETSSLIPQRHNSTSMVLPPPSPSAQTLLSAGATGPPNPFARPPPQQNVNNDTPVSALPSRFLNDGLLPSPSSFYPEWNFRGGDSNTLPSPLNFATPVVGTGPSFLRDDHPLSNGTSAASVPTITTTAASGSILTHPSGLSKRKSPEYEINGHHDPHDTANDPKRLRVE
ncbi:MADS-box MEF2 type transcription factor MIG1 [Cladobotryum mycophilum]|uniref:MADS-box MEF2 type transcription factor MIG1 n=1 Tax=Cladobotryum mycophilum TaxID=491253 RepID=A0ABR0SL25_9HYPO